MDMYRLALQASARDASRHNRIFLIGFDLALQASARDASAKMHKCLNGYTDYMCISLYLTECICGCEDTDLCILSRFSDAESPDLCAKVQGYICSLIFRTTIILFFDEFVNIFDGNILACVVVCIFFKTAFQAAKPSLRHPVGGVDIPAAAAPLARVFRLHFSDLDPGFFRFIFDLHLQIIICPVFQEAVGIFCDSGQILHLNHTAVVPNGILHYITTVFVVHSVPESCDTIFDLVNRFVACMT